MAPFKSEAQRRAFHRLEQEGRISKTTVDKWEKETPAGKLVERVTPKKAPKAPKQKIKYR